MADTSNCGGSGEWGFLTLFGKLLWNFSKVNIEGEAPPTCLEPTHGFLFSQ